MIFLTAAEAEMVRGLSPTKAGHGLVPVECEDGSFKLGEEVLGDPAFAHVREFLASLPRGEDDRPAKILAEVDYAELPLAALSVWSAEPEVLDTSKGRPPVLLVDEHDASSLPAGFTRGTKGGI